MKPICPLCKVTIDEDNDHIFIEWHEPISRDIVFHHHCYETKATREGRFLPPRKKHPQQGVEPRSPSLGEGMLPLTPLGQPPCALSPKINPSRQKKASMSASRVLHQLNTTLQSKANPFYIISYIFGEKVYDNNLFP